MFATLPIYSFEFRLVKVLSSFQLEWYPNASPRNRSLLLTYSYMRLKMMALLSECSQFFKCFIYIYFLEIREESDIRRESYENLELQQ